MARIKRNTDIDNAIHEVREIKSALELCEQRSRVACSRASKMVAHHQATIEKFTAAQVKLQDLVREAIS